GSPATRLSTSTPLATSALTLAFWASVCDGLTGCRRRARCMPHWYQRRLTRFKADSPKTRGGLRRGAHAPADFPNLLCSLARTFPGTKPLTLPPREATSRTSFADT